MAILTAGELTNLRTKQHSANLYLSVFQPVSLLVAAVNNVSIARGARTIVYDSGSGTAAEFNTIEAGQTLEVDTATGTEYVRVKSIAGNQTAGTITIAENGINWADDLVIRIKHNYEIWPVFPAIRSGVFYKDYNVAYGNQNSQPNPVAIIGPHLADFLPTALALNASNSYATAQGAAIASYAWVCVHNGGATTGISFSDTGNNTSAIVNPTLTITEVGQYWLKCTVTDNQSPTAKTQSTYRAIFVYSSANPPEIDFTVQQLTADWDSAQWRCTLNITGDSTLTDLPDGSLAVLWYQNYFDSTEGYVNIWAVGDNIIYTGYLWSDNDTDNWETGVGAATFEIISPLAYLDAITDYGTVSLEAATNPLKWSEYASWLTVGRGIHHLLKWDTTVLETCDVLGLTDNTYGVKVLEFTEDTILQRIQGVAYQRGIHAKLVSSRLGQLYLVRDSQMLNTASRAALDTVCTLTAADISGGVNLVRNNETTRAFADLDGFTYSHPTSTPFISMIPGYVESTVSYNLPMPRGIGTEQNKQQVLNSAGGQADCNERAGRSLALANISPREVRINARGCYLGAFDIVPSIGWYEWGIADNALKRELELNGILFVCRSVTHQFLYNESRFTGFIQTTEIVLQPEASGPDGIPGNYPTTYPTIKTPAPTWDEPAGADLFGIAYSDQNDSSKGKVIFGSLTSLAAAYTFNNAATYFMDICAISNTQALIAWWSDATGDGSVAVLTIDEDGSVTAMGTPQVFFNAAGLNYRKVSIRLTSTTSFVLVFDEEDGPTIQAVAGAISGSTITLGSNLTLTTTDKDASEFSFCVLSATRFIVFWYANPLGGREIRASIIDISGTVLTEGGSDLSIPLTTNSSGSLAATPLDSATCVLCSAHNEDPGSVPVIRSLLVFSITGSTLSSSTDILIGSNIGTFDFMNEFAVTLDSTHALVVFPDTAAPFSLEGVVITSDGADVTSGGIENLVVDATLSYAAPQVAMFSSTVVYFAYLAELTAAGNLAGIVRSLGISGNTITANADNQTFDALVENAISDNAVVSICTMG